jgi:flagellar basal body rod protein FlgB
MKKLSCLMYRENEVIWQKILQRSQEEGKTAFELTQATSKSHIQTFQHISKDKEHTHAE